MNTISRRIFAVSLLLFCSLVLARDRKSYRTLARFEGPAETFGTPAQLDSLVGEIGSSPADAARRVDALLREHAGELTAPDDGRLISIACWLDGLSAKDRASLAAEYQKQFDAPAAAALKSLQQNLAARAEEFYFIARRWPFSSWAAPALIEAGDRAARAGDSFATAAFYEQARVAGWKPDDRRAVVLSASHALNNEPNGNLPSEAKAGNYQGPLPFDATWYNRGDPVGLARYFPLAADGAVYLATPRSMMALREDGQLVWSWTAQQAPTFRLDRDHIVGRGPNVNVASLSGVEGAQVLVVRQPRLYNADYCLRAFRALDGKLLWTSETLKNLDDINFISAPTVAGRYVYCTCLTFPQGGPAELGVLALDVMDGHVLWKTAVGTVRDLPRYRDSDRGHGWDTFWEQSEPCVAGDLLCLAPNVGLVLAIDRFDGKLRWARAYKESKPGADPNRRNGRWDRGDEQEPIPTNPIQLQRYSGTPRVAGLYGGAPVLLAAPQDSAGFMGLGLKQGDVVFEDPAPPLPTLIAATGDVGILAGASIQGVNPSTGKVRWVWNPPAPATITGPPALIGQTLYVPTTDKVLAVATADGKTVDEPKPKAPTFRTTTGSESAKKLMEEAGKTFGLPPK